MKRKTKYGRKVLKCKCVLHGIFFLHVLNIYVNSEQVQTDQTSRVINKWDRKLLDRKTMREMEEKIWNTMTILIQRPAIRR